MRKPSIMVKQTKSKKKLKYKHFSPIIFVKLVISAGKKGRQSKTRLVEALVDSGASESILAKASADKMPVKRIRRNNSGLRPLVSLSPTQKQQQASVSLNYMLIN